MTLTPPYYLHGEAGAGLDVAGYSFAALGVEDATLTLKSWDADELRFTLKEDGSGPVPSDGQWLTLQDATGTRLFTGIARRSTRYPEMIHTYLVSNVYDGLMRTPLLDGGRNYVLYQSLRLDEVMADMLDKATAAGLPIQKADDMPEFHIVPKSAYRATTIGAALESALKWAPDAASRMDYTTEPPTLRVTTRRDASPVSIDVFSRQIDGGFTLNPKPEARALYLEIVSATRGDGNEVIKTIQAAGDPDAEASRRLSVFLSGEERTDLLAAEALARANYAVQAAQQVATATATTITAAATSGRIVPNWSWLVANDSNLFAAAQAELGFVMGSAGGAYGGYYKPLQYSPTPLYFPGIYLGNAAQQAISGWYPVQDGVYSEPQYASVGVVKATGYICGYLVHSTGNYPNYKSAGELSLYSSAASQVSEIWKSNLNSGTGVPYYVLYRVFIPVTIISKPLEKVASLLASTVANTKTSLQTRAEFVEAPAGLAADYFDRQNWLPYQGQIPFVPGAEIPRPGDFINVTGENVPAEWTTMKAPVAATTLDLRTGRAAITLGSPPRMDYHNLSDRLRIPAEDNYQPG